VDSVRWHRDGRFVGIQQNAYIVHLPGESVRSVDPGWSPRILHHLTANLVPAAIWLTHGPDHTAGTAVLKQPLVGLSDRHRPADALKLTDAELNLAIRHGADGPPADRLVDEGDVVSAAGIDWDARRPTYLRTCGLCGNRGAP
jgi:hypothetical protein